MAARKLLEGQRLLREATRWISQRRLARILDVEQGTISRWTTERAPVSPTILFALEVLLGIPLRAWATTEEMAGMPQRVRLEAERLAEADELNILERVRESAKRLAQLAEAA
jgi:transcriptional regulator with XRE-family HTH domain